MSQPKEDRKDQIFALGAHLFAEKGYERTSLQEVADALGVTKPALYYYYRSKEELLFEIMSFVMDRVLADLEAAVAVSPDPVEKMREFVRRYVRFFAAHPHELTLMSTAVPSLGPDRREVIDRRQRRYMDLLRGIVRELLDRRPGRRLDEVVVGFGVLGAMDWIFTWYDPDGRIGPDELADQFIELFSSGLLGTREA